MTELEQLRQDLGLKPGELLENEDGLTADILHVEGDIVTLGVLSQMKCIEVSRSQLVKERP